MSEAGYFYASCTLDLDLLPAGQIPSGNNQFVFENCKFDLSVQGVPANPARELLLAGLKQSDTATIKVGMTGM